MTGHSTFNNSLHLVTGVHTQNEESYWNRVVKRMNYIGHAAIVPWQVHMERERHRCTASTTCSSTSVSAASSEGCSCSYFQPPCLKTQTLHLSPLSTSEGIIEHVVNVMARTHSGKKPLYTGCCRSCLAWWSVT